MNNFRGHNFIQIDNTIRIYGIHQTDLMCLNCGICVNHKFNIIFVKNNLAIDTNNNINDYELNCNELIIKQLLE